MLRTKRRWTESTKIRKLLPMVKSRKLKYFGHISRHTSLEKDIMLDTMPGLRRQGGQRKEWSDDLVEWTGETIPDLVRKAEDRSAFQRFVYEVAHARASLRHLDCLIDDHPNATPTHTVRKSLVSPLQNGSGLLLHRPHWPHILHVYDKSVIAVTS